MGIVTVNPRSPSRACWPRRGACSGAKVMDGATGTNTNECVKLWLWTWDAVLRRVSVAVGGCPVRVLRGVPVDDGVHVRGRVSVLVSCCELLDELPSDADGSEMLRVTASVSVAVAVVVASVVGVRGTVAVNGTVTVLEHTCVIVRIPVGVLLPSPVLVALPVVARVPVAT